MLEGEFISLIKGNFIINCCLHMHACIQDYIIKHLSKITQIWWMQKVNKTLVPLHLWLNLRL